MGELANGRPGRSALFYGRDACGGHVPVPTVKQVLLAHLGCTRIARPDTDPGRDATFGVWLDRHVRAAGTVAYDLPHPKHELLWWATEQRGFLLHGSPDAGVTLFHPRRQRTFYGRPIDAVFATSDPVWPIFFAILDRDRVAGTRNGCFTAGPHRYYYFAVPTGSLSHQPWRRGAVYLVPRDGFRRTASTQEWVATTSVAPVAQLDVGPEDFPLLSRVEEFDPAQSTFRFFLDRARR